MITFGRKLKHLRQKNHLTQKELGIAVGFPDSCAVELFTVPVLSESREYEAGNIGGMS